MLNIILNGRVLKYVYSVEIICIRIESVKSASMEDVSTKVLEKNKYLRR